MAVDDSYTKSLLHFDGVDASTTFTDESGKTWTAAADAQIDTAQSKFGGASGYFDGVGDSISTPDHADFSVGSGDFTVDAWIRPASTSAGNHIICYHPGAGTYSWINLMRVGTSIALYSSSTGASWNVANGVSLGTVAQDTWYHVAIARSGNDLHYFFDGTKIGTIDVTGLTLLEGTGSVYIGSSGAGDQFWDGWVEEFRFSLGIARWTNSFVPPTAAYSEPTINASLLIPFTLSGTMLNGAIGDINATLPISFSLSGTMTAPVPTINAALPIALSLSATMRFGNNIAATLPIALGMSGTMHQTLAGGVLYVTNPMQEVSFTGILDCIGLFNFDTPMSRILMEGRVDEVGSFNFAAPTMEISLTGLTGQIGDFAVKTPMQVFTATGIISETGDLTVTTPMMKLVFTGAQDIIVSALDLTVPMQEVSFTGILSPFGTLSLTVPMMEITFKGLPASFLNMVMNLRNQGLTEYTNYDFNSLCRFKGRHLAATSTGVYELDSGTTDDGDQIDWNIRTGYMDTEQKEKLRLRQAWVSYKSNGDLMMTVILPDGSEYEYDLEGYDVTENGVRVKFGRGIRSKYIALDLKNVDGSSLTLDAIKLHLDKTGLAR